MYIKALCTTQQQIINKVHQRINKNGMMELKHIALYTVIAGDDIPTV